jgi:hypothetical protein
MEPPPTPLENTNRVVYVGEKASYITDGDNYLDVCLKLTQATLGNTAGLPTTPAVGKDTMNMPNMPASVYLPCGASTQISAPKGTRFPCKPQEVAITSSMPPPPPPPPLPPPPGCDTCRAINPLATDDWCKQRCCESPPNWPANLCKC